MSDYFREDHQIKLVKMLKMRGSNLLSQMHDADKVRKEQVGDTVTFVRNQNITFSNICYKNCRFCAFGVSEDSEKAYRMNDNLLTEKAKLANIRGVSEICATGGIDPQSDLYSYLNILQIFKRNSPDSHIHAFSPFEIQYLAKREGVDPEYILKTLKEAGLGSLCGTAAEILVPRVRNILNPNKITAEQWISIIITAHELGIPTTATMMYGHIENVEDIARHLQIIRGIQEETGGFTEFVPLPFIHHNTDIYRSGLARAGSTGMEDMAVYSTSRLYLGDVLPNLQSSWVKTGIKFAGLSLAAGVNDLGGTLFEERITRFAGGNNGVYMSENELIRVIHDAGRDAARRTTLYSIIETFPRLSSSSSKNNLKPNVRLNIS